MSKHWVEERYGIPYADYLTIMRLQDHRCAVCWVHQADYRTHFDIKVETMELMCGRHKHVEDGLQSAGG